MVYWLARNWGWVMLRGIVALIFGLLTLFNPELTLLVLVMFFGAYALVDGVVTIISAIIHRRGERRWAGLLVRGVVGIAAGLVTFAMPAITGLVLLYVIATWAVITGLLEIATAVNLRKILRGEWLLILAGVLSVAFGLFLFAAPGAGALTVALWIGAYAVLFGILLISLAIRLRGWLRSAEGSAAAQAG
jgi:uncharacterized membrane protein HdeD (DUF308 family)